MLVAVSGADSNRSVDMLVYSLPSCIEYSYFTPEGSITYESSKTGMRDCRTFPYCTVL